MQLELFLTKAKSHSNYDSQSPSLETQESFTFLQTINDRVNINLDLDKRFPCTFPKCNKSFARAGRLDMHKRTVHMGQGLH